THYRLAASRTVQPMVGLPRCRCSLAQRRFGRAGRPTRGRRSKERLNKEVKRRADLVGIFSNEASITPLIGAVLLEQNDEWLLQCHYMQTEGVAELTHR